MYSILFFELFSRKPFWLRNMWRRGNTVLQKTFQILYSHIRKYPRSQLRKWICFNDITQSTYSYIRWSSWYHLRSVVNAHLGNVTAAIDDLDKACSILESMAEANVFFALFSDVKVNTVVACRYELVSLLTSLGDLDGALRMKSYLFEQPIFGSESWEYVNHKLYDCGVIDTQLSTRWLECHVHQQPYRSSTASHLSLSHRSVGHYKSNRRDGSHVFGSSFLL